MLAPSPRRRAFSLIELLFVIAIISLLIAMAMPALGRAREYARFLRWSALSHSMQTDPDLSLYMNFQDQPEGATELWNKAAGSVLGAAPGIDDAQFAFVNQHPNLQGIWDGTQLAAATDGLLPLLPSLLTGALSDPSDLNASFGAPGSPPGYDNDHPKWTEGRWEHKRGLQFGPSRVLYGSKHPKLDLGTDDFTIVYWFKLDPGASYGGIVFSRFDPSTSEGFYIRLNVKGDIVRPEFVWGTRDGLTRSYVPNYVEPLTHDDHWHQIAIRRIGRVISFWIDGNQHVGRAFVPTDLSADAAFTIGNGDIWGGEYYTEGFPGVIDELAVYRRGLMPHEIVDFYEIGRPTSSDADDQPSREGDPAITAG